MRAHGEEEVVAVEGVEGQVRASGDGRGAGNGAQERDLAEEVARPLLAQVGSVARDLGAALVDDVEPIARISLADDYLARTHAHEHEPEGASRIPPSMRRVEHS